ncbi:MAG: DUF4404 family protein [Elusimicrobia bacterium]|nr:DUF4404 family protein [Elusimicrobiota bacterium]
MLDEAIKKLEDAVRRVDTKDAAERDELLKALKALKAEAARLSEREAEGARSVAGFMAVAAHEAARRERPEGLLKHSLEGLSLSAKGFETSHPELVELLDRICVMLARIGI